MNWIGQNWIWVVVLAVGLMFLMRRRAHHRGFGHSMSHHHRHGDGYDGSSPAQGMDGDGSRDPVSGGAIVPGGSAISAVFRGRAYYFENAENRAAFEANPQRYAETGYGQPIPDERPGHRHYHRRGGC